MLEESVRSNPSVSLPYVEVAKCFASQHLFPNSISSQDQAKIKKSKISPKNMAAFDSD